MAMEHFSYFEVFLLVAAGILTGIINTLAGSGTIVSLGAMIWIGIPVTLANTTNRIGVLFQNSSAILTLRFFNTWSSASVRKIHLGATLTGALAGGVAASRISTGSLEVIASIVLVLLMAAMLADVKKLLEKKNILLQKMPWPVHALIFFAIGFYGGFIQIGIGIMLVVALHLFAGQSMLLANLNKLLIILIYTIPTSIYFILMDQILWIPAICLSAGQVIGAVAAGYMTIRIPNVETWLRWFIIVMTVATVARLLVY